MEIFWKTLQFPYSTTDRRLVYRRFLQTGTQKNNSYLKHQVTMVM